MTGAEVLTRFTADTKDVEKGIKGAQNKLAGFGNAIKSAFAVATVSITATGVAIGKLAYESSKQYAEYEQLVGGVETLFSESESEIKAFEKIYGKTWEELKSSPEGFSTTVDQVLGNANDAYKTAGLSANEYMNTVMGFSASLKQAVKGNSWAMMEYADMAVVDMADNANKMGTSMEMIQNAYQGFAKQNYTMLDNLKLGYGGTKTEMQRLIDDANKVKKANGEMANLSINSFADVVEAIHIIQDEMGITGTTAKEANETIEGSLNSLKSSWKNVLLSFSGGGVDVETAFNNLMESAGTFANNLAPIIEKALNSIVDYIPKIADKVIKELPKLASKIIPKAVGIAKKIIKSVISIFPENISGPLGSIFDTLTTMIGQVATTVIPILVEAIKTIIPPLLQIIQAILPVVQQLLNAILPLLQPLMNLLKPIINVLMAIITPLVEIISTILPPLIDLFSTIMEVIIPPLTFAFEMLATSVESSIKTAFNVIKPTIDAIKTTLSGITDFIGGIFTGNWERVWNGVKNIFKGIWDGFIAIVKAPLNWIIGAINGFIDGLNKIQIPDWVPAVGGKGLNIPNIPFLNVGTNYVPDDTLAMIHKGEAVIPKKFNPYANGIKPQTIGSMNAISPTINVQVYNDIKQDPLGQMVSNIKTFSGGAKNDYNYGMGN